MDGRIQAFLGDVLALEGKHSNLVREGVRNSVAKYERLFRNAEANENRKDKAAEACDRLCRARVVDEMQQRQRRGTLTAVHLKIVLSVIEGPARFPLEDC